MKHCKMPHSKTYSTVINNKMCADQPSEFHYTWLCSICGTWNISKTTNISFSFVWIVFCFKTIFM